MVLFRIVLVAMTIVLLAYTATVGMTHGWNFFPIFLRDILALTWPGQFNVDFTCFLLFSGIWLAWRNHFTVGGVALGFLGVVGGALVLAPYLLFASIQAKGDIKAILLGRVRAAS
jgi:hypothetical protein